MTNARSAILIACTACLAAAIWMAWPSSRDVALIEDSPDHRPGEENEPLAATIPPLENDPDEPDRHPAGADRIPLTPRPGQDADDPATILPGRIRFEVADAAGIDPIDGLEIRFMSRKRFATYHGPPAGEVPLSEGEYEVAFLARGFDPRLLRGVMLRTEETTDLGTIGLVAGSASIAGFIDAPNLDPGRAVTVELHGEGRRSCPRCVNGILPGEEEEKNCPCGYSREKTVRRLEGDLRFRFDCLAEGTYFLTVRCERSKQTILREIALSIGEHRSMSIDLIPDTTVRFLLANAHGAPFFPDAPTADDFFEMEPFEEEVPGFDPVRFSFRRDGEEMARAEVWPDLYGTVIMESECSFEIDGFYGEMKPPGPMYRIDRERKQGDGLSPVRYPPHVGAIELESKRLNNNDIILYPIPAVSLEVVVSVGNLSSGSIPLDLTGWTGTPVTVILR